MLTPQQLANSANDIVNLYGKFDEMIVQDIARRIVKAGEVTDTAIFQLHALQNSGMLYDEIIMKVAEITKKSDEAISRLFIDAAVQSLKYDMSIYRAAGLNPLPLNMSPSAIQVLEAGILKTQGNLNNLTRTTAVSAQKAFISASTMAEMQVESGAYDVAAAIRTAIKTVAANGAEVIYPSGHTDKLDVAVRRNVMTGLGQTTSQISELYADEMECDIMEITAHSGARPTHAAWQGQLVSRSGKRGYLSLDDIGYGTGAGFAGWNCRHDWYPYIEGISSRMYDNKSLAALEEKNIEYNGNKYTEYEAEQKMRVMERQIRATKRELLALQAAIQASENDVSQDGLKIDYAKSSVKLKRQKSQLSNFSETTGILKDTARAQVYGFGRSEAQKAAWANRRYQEAFS